MDNWAEKNLHFSQEILSQAGLLGAARTQGMAKLFERTAGLIRATLTMRRESEEALAHIAAQSPETAARHSGSVKVLKERCALLDSQLHTLTQKAAELSQLDEKISSFVYIAAHELREPLRKMTAFFVLLDEALSDADQAKIKEASCIIQESSPGTRELVSNILEYARLAMAERKTEILDLREQTQLVLDDLSQSIAVTGAEVHLLSPSLRFRGDRSQFLRLVRNIILNAIRYKKQGTAPVIDINASSVNNQIKLVIADNGVGFNQEFAKLIFDPFKRPDTEYEYPGTGIGLAICKSICDRNHWNISVESTPGQGTTFSLAIPAVTES